MDFFQRKIISISWQSVGIRGTREFSCYPLWESATFKETASRLWERHSQGLATGGGGQVARMQTRNLDFRQHDPMLFDFLVERAAWDSQSPGRPLDMAVLLSEDSLDMPPFKFQEGHRGIVR
jgi:hypothetical protein